MPTSGTQGPESLSDRAFCVSDIKQAVMDRTQYDTAQLRAIYALAQARKYRHHPDCQCRKYQRTACTAAAALWENALNRELEKTREANHV